MGKVSPTYSAGLLVLLVLIIFLPNAFAQNDLSSVLKNAQKSLSADSDSTDSSSKNIPNYKVYQNQTYGVKVNYPQDWTYGGTANDEWPPDTIFNVNFFSPISNKGVVLLSVGIQKLKPIASLEEYKNRILTNMKNNNDTKDISVSKDTLNGKPAYRIEDMSFFIDHWEKSISIYSITKDKLYEVDILADPDLVEKHSEEIKNMIQSVQFNQPSSTSSTVKIGNVQQTQPTFSNQKCGVSIHYPKDWKAEVSQFVFEDKAKGLADFQSADDDILTLQLSIENIGLAKRSPQDISRLERESASLADSTVLDTDTGIINGFPSYKTVYRQGSVGKYELQADKFHDMEILIIAFDREYRLVFEAADKAAFDKYQSIVEDMAQTIKISEPKFEGINC